MKRSSLIPIAVALLFVGLICHILACVAGLVAALLFAAIWPFLFLRLTLFFELELERPWLNALLPTSSILGGTVVAFLGGTTFFEMPMWLTPLVSAAVSGIFLAIQRSQARKCSLCNRRIGAGVAFDCPRCGLMVCERKCWNFDHSRCALCEQNRVPVLPMDGRWWDKRLGPRSNFGRCQICQCSAQEVDLRTCAKCGRPHCRECWDYLNGQCSRCAWVMNDLPESLKAFLINS